MTPEKAGRGVYVAPARTLLIAALFLTVFGAYGGWHFLRSLEPLTWQSAPCKVVRFEIRDNADSKLPFEADTRFEFYRDGVRHTGTGLGIGGWKDSREAWTHALRFKEDPEASCYLPDGNPANAVLFRPPPAWGGLAFVGFSAGIGWILLMAHRRRDRVSMQLLRGVAPALVLLFGTPGVLLTAKLSLPVWVESLQARTWKPTTAKVVWSRLRTQDNRGRHHPTHYRADICYEYHAGGRIWRQNRVFPGNFSAGGSGTARQLSADHPAGKTITCLVDPDHPERSLLKPHPGWSLLFTLFPLPFLAVAVIILRQALRQSAESR